MKIIVLMKQIQDSKNPRFHKDTCRLIRNSSEGVLNYDDGNALEMALQIKENALEVENVKIIASTMGAIGNKKILEEALALGADEAYFITDEWLKGADTIVTAKCLASVIEKIGNYDLILAGYKSQDGKTGNVGPMVAEYLGIPQITYVDEFHLQGNHVMAIVDWNDYNEVISVGMPCLLVINKKKYGLRGMTLKGIQNALKMNITTWMLEDIQGFSVDWQAKTVVMNMVENIKKREHKIVNKDKVDGAELSNVIGEIITSFRKLI